MDQNSLTIVCISDTHCKFVELPPGDILIHCGDFSRKKRQRGEAQYDNAYYVENEIQFQIEAFIEWLVKQPFEHKIVVAGNHDLPLDEEAIEFNAELKEILKSCCHYLENSSVVLEGYKFWGSPQTIGGEHYAFTISKKDAPSHWQQIDQDCDFVLTHVAPYNFIGNLHSAYQYGDMVLLERIRKIRPKYHIFGHIHEGYGKYECDGIQFINCAINDYQVNILNAPIKIKVPKKE